MFFLDDVLLAPGKAAYVVFEQLVRKAQEEWLNDDTVKQELAELYTLLESGRISDKEFEEKECRLLERLEQIARMKFKDKWGAGESEPPSVEAEVVVSPIAPIEEPPVTVTMLPPPAPDPQPVLPAPPRVLPVPQPVALSMPAAIDKALAAVAMLKMKVSSVTSVLPADGGWVVAVELVEKRGIPDSNDVLGLYELRLDAAGTVLRYERTQMRRRGDLGR